MSGTHVCTRENDNTRNVYVNYSCAAGQVWGEPEADPGANEPSPPAVRSAPEGGASRGFHTQHFGGFDPETALRSPRERADVDSKLEDQRKEICHWP